MLQLQVSLSKQCQAEIFEILPQINDIQSLKLLNYIFNFTLIKEGLLIEIKF